MDVEQLPIDSYARRSIGFGGEFEDNEDLQHESNEAGIRRAGREVGIRLADGISAWDYELHRKGWNAAIDRMVEGVSGGMSVWRVDRYTRQMYELESMLRRLDKAGRHGCVLVSMGQVYELDNPMHRRMLRMQVMEAQGSSDTTSFSSRQALKRQRKQGVWNGAGRRIFGFPGADMLAEPVEGFGKEKRRPMVAEEVWRRERKAVKWAYEAFLHEDKSLTDIAREWNAAGLTGTFGTPFTNITVRQVLGRQLNCGRLVHEGVVVGRATNIEPIIDEQTFDNFQAILVGRKRGRSTSLVSLGSGIIVCSVCGRRLVSRPRYRGDGQAVPAYKCHWPKGCGRIGIDQAPVDRRLRQLTIQRLSDPKIAEKISAVATEQSAAVEQLRAKLATARENEVELTTRFATGDLSSEAFGAGHRIFAARIGELEAALAEAVERAGDVEATEAASRAAVTQEWDEAAAAGDVEKLRSMIKSALRLVEVVIQPGYRENRKGPVPAENRITVHPVR